MAKIKLNKLGINQFGGFTPYGNLTTLRSTLQTAATGAAINANSTAALAVNDKVYLQTLPAGFLLEGAQAIVSTALTAGVTGKLGFEYVDGVDSPDAPQDDAFFDTGLVLSSVSRILCATAKVPAVLAKEAYLVLTVTGAANAKAGRVDFIVHGERLGAQ